jgi:CNT family concentrative nucleoside transporter
LDVIRTLLCGLAFALLVSALGVPQELEASSSAITATLEQQTPTDIRSGFETDLQSTIGERLRSAVGLVVLLLIAWGLSVDRSRVSWRIVGWGIGLQLIFGLFILKTPIGTEAFDLVNGLVLALLNNMEQGARFVFGNLIYNNIPVGEGPVGNGPFDPAPGTVANAGGFFAFYVLSTIIFFSSLMTVLYHLGIMQRIVKGFAWVMQRTMGTSGAETLSAAGNIFVGQTEAPLLVKPFVEKMTRSELMSVMTGGFATVAGGVLAAYVGLLVGVFPDIAGHLMAASVMSAPAALVVAKLMVPEVGKPETAGTLDLNIERPDVNVIQAAARGASDGVRLAVNVGAMLLAFTALVYLFNGLLGWSTALVGLEGITLERILGWVLAPLAWIMGVNWADAQVVGSLMGIKTVLNEFFAYLQLAVQLDGPDALAPRSIVIATYALSGFANFSSIAIQIGGIGGIAPGRVADLSQLGLRAMVGGSLAGFMTATVAGMLL